MKEEKYYTLKNILPYKAKYNVIFGERSNGKTYAVLYHSLEQYFKNGSELAIIRRYSEDFKGKRGASVFKNLICNDDGVNSIEKLSRGEWNSVMYYSSRWYLQKVDKNDPKNTITSDVPFAYAFALSDVEHDKSSSYPNVRNIFFDEFMTRSYYLPDEFVTFMNVLSTIIRLRDDVTIFMCGNTVNKYCPYFREMGLINITKMQKGKIDLYSYGDSELTVAVEFSDFPVKKKKSDVYFAFNNPKLKMITSGTWEIDIYPHLTEEMKYKPNQILYTYFINFDNQILQCEIVFNGKYGFTYIHKKTTPIKDDGVSIVYQEEYDPRKNYKRKITKPTMEIESKIIEFFKSDKVFYQDNEIGEVVRNYLQWCKSIN